MEPQDQLFHFADEKTEACPRLYRQHLRLESLLPESSPSAYFFPPYKIHDPRI